MCAAGVAHAEYVKPSGRGLEDTLVDDEMGGEDGVKAKMSKTVAFYDLDHTIIDTNSSWHWVQHEMNTGRIGVGMVFTALYWFARYAAGFGAGAERAGAEAAELYAGTLESELQVEVERCVFGFYTYQIPPTRLFTLPLFQCTTRDVCSGVRPSQLPVLYTFTM